MISPPLHADRAEERVVEIALVWTHFVADFIFQTDRMALNKSTSSRWLTSHVCVYTLFLIPFGPKFALINGLAHWITDFISSRMTTALWKQQKRHLFFVVIGLDQAVHMTCLFATIPFMEPVWKLVM